MDSSPQRNCVTQNAKWKISKFFFPGSTDNMQNVHFASILSGPGPPTTQKVWFCVSSVDLSEDPIYKD